MIGQIFVVLASLLAERLRANPQAPAALTWGLHLLAFYVTVNGHALRYVKMRNLHSIKEIADV